LRRHAIPALEINSVNEDDPALQLIAEAGLLRYLVRMNASINLIQLVLPATVAVKADVPETHPSAQILGTQRLGSGVIIDSAGLVLTVNYIVLGAQSVEVSLLDDTTVPAKIAAQDFSSGIAVIDIGGKVPSALSLCPASELTLGQEIFIAAATGENKRRASNGAITSLACFDAYWEYALERAITTSAMNPGLGGAPLLDMRGRVAGVVSLDLGEVGRFTLAIPVDYYMEHREELLRHGRRTTQPLRAWVGLYCYTFRQHVVIAGVLPGAPAEQAGLKPGDVVLTVNGQQIQDRHQLYTSLWAHRPGELINFRIFRNNEIKQIAVASTNAEEFFA
jgi:S1-C subfamily serine protease